MSLNALYHEAYTTHTQAVGRNGLHTFLGGQQAHFRCHFFKGLLAVLTTADLHGPFTEKH